MGALPKKLTRSGQYSCVVDDERKRPAIFTANDYDDNERFKDEIVKRYNDYNLLKVYVVCLGLTVFTLILALCSQN